MIRSKDTRSAEEVARLVDQGWSILSTQIKDGHIQYLMVKGYAHDMDTIKERGVM